MMAHALGGKVDRSDRGWQVGVKEAIPVDAPQVLGSEPFRVIHSNADQIHDLPDTMRVIATSPTNPIEVIAVGDHFLGLQGHPEFTVEYSEALMRARRGTLIPDDIVDAGIASLALGPDRERLADVLIRFLH
jgi:GMP synthase-like glutamine amidotransferase